MQNPRKELQKSMQFLVSLFHGMEKAGTVADRISYRAGQNLGKEYSIGAKTTQDSLEAIGIVKDILYKKGFKWNFEAWKQANQPSYIEEREPGKKIIKLVFRDCMIRQSLFVYGHEQKKSLCQIMYGFFSGAMEKVLNKKCTLEILHTGENACLKALILEERFRQNTKICFDEGANHDPS
ncbi:MAG: hypothetical protein HUU50_02005 [Candidatus Brocadiae bacterium]|nr:hypothetical protein [Candidatus Brocadiia bacterium]